MFGSQARGDARPDSDIGLLVVVDDDAPAEMSLCPHAGLPTGYHNPVEVIPVREATFQRKAHIPGTLSRAAVREGVVAAFRFLHT